MGKVTNTHLFYTSSLVWGSVHTDKLPEICGINQYLYIFFINEQTRLFKVTTWLCSRNTQKIISGCSEAKLYWSEKH